MLEAISRKASADPASVENAATVERLLRALVEGEIDAAEFDASVTGEQLGKAILTWGITSPLGKMGHGETIRRERDAQERRTRDAWERDTARIAYLTRHNLPAGKVKSLLLPGSSPTTAK